MAFSNLFTRLSEVEGADDPRHGNEFNKGQEGSLKRNPQTDPQFKRRRLHSYAASSDVVRNEAPKAHEADRFNWAKNNPRDDHYRGNANYIKRKKMKNKGNIKRENALIYENAQRNKRGRNQDNAPPRKPFFSQEFKEKHCLEVEGRLLCLYFLRGRCTKGEECQFEHSEVCNGLIKEACKFYIEGSCYKGKNCPYMHETFPCKFFHAKGFCRRAECKFSHDPLTDVTKKLLDDFLRRENELLEWQKKAEEEALRKTEENVSEAVEGTLDIVIPTATPSFYQSAAVEEDTLMPDEEQPNEDDKMPQTENNEEPEDALPSALEQPGPMCYSVEAVLGPRLYKPCFYTTPKSQEASQSEPKTTSDSTLNILYSPYSVANVLKSSITLSHLHSPSIAPAVASSHESNYKETGVKLEDKYSVFPFVQEKTLKEPPSFYNSPASGYLYKQCEKTAMKPASCGRFKAKGELTIGSSAPNLMLEDEKITKREYKPLMRRDCLTQNYLTPQVQKDKFEESDSKLSQDKPSLKNNGTFLSKTLSIQQKLGETNSESETSLKNDNRQESVASPCNKTTRLNSLFASLTPDVDRTSSLRVNVRGKTSESDCASQKVHSREAKKRLSFIGNASENTRDGYSSKIKRKETERDASPASKKCHGLFENLPEKIARTSTVIDSFCHKPTVPSALKRGKSICASEKISYGSYPPPKQSLFTRNTSESTNSNSSHLNLSKKLVSTSAIANVNFSNQEKDVESANTPPAKSFQSLFTSLTSDSDQAPTVSNSFSNKPTVPSAQKRGKSICASEKINCGSNKATKPSQFTGNTSESTNSNTGNLSKKFVSTSAAASLKSNQVKDIEKGKTPPAKSFQSLFTSLAPGFELNSTACNSFSDKPDVPSPQKVEKTTSSFTENTSESTNRSSSNHTQVCSAAAATSKTQINNSQGLLTSPATSKLKDSNITHDIVSAKTPPTKPFQSLFTSLTPDSHRSSTVSKCFGDKQAVPSEKCEKLKEKKSEKINCSKPSTITDNRSERTNTSGTSNHSKFVSAAIMTNLKCSKKEEDIEDAKTSPAKSFQSLFASLAPDSGQASTVSNSFSENTAVPSAQKVEKSVCASEKISCGSNKATKPSTFIVNASKSRNDSRSNDGTKLISTSAAANVKCAKKEEEVKSAKTPPAKSFQSLFKSLTPDSDQASTFISTFSEKTSAKRDEKSICDRKRIKCNTLRKNGQRFVSPSATSDLKSKNEQEDVETPPAKSFQSLFTSLTPDSGQASTVSNSFSEKTAVSSAQKVEKSVCASEKMDYSSNKAAKPSPFTGNTSVSQQSLVSVPATDNLKCSKKEEDIESAKTPPAKSFQSRFTSLAPDSDQTSTVSNNFSDKPDVPRAQKVEKFISDGHKVEYDLNQARKSRNDGESTTESAETLSKNGQKFGSASGTSDFKSKNQEEDVETPVKSCQSLFASLTPTVGKSVNPNVSDLSVEKSINNSQKDNCQAVSTTEQNQLTKNLSESTNNGSSSRHREVALVSERTETSGKSDQKWISPSATSNLKTKNSKDDTDSAKTSPATSFQSLFTSLSPEAAQTSTVQKDEKSLYHSQKVTKQSQYNESTTGTKVGLEAARMETLNDNRPKSGSSSAMQSNSEEQNKEIGSANAPAKSFHNLFSAPLDESAVTNDSKTQQTRDSSVKATMDLPIQF